MKKYILLIFVSLTLLLNSCEDPIPKDYIPVTLVEGLLVVGEPIDNIKISRTLSIFEQYNEKEASINDAEVYIYEGDIETKLKLTTDSIGKYIDIRNDYVVKPNTTYYLNIILANGDTLKGKTTTPNTISWGNNSLPAFLQYPSDTINLPTDTNVAVQWERNPDNKNTFHILSITCNDTLNYGKYLIPPTDELNRRTRHRRNENDENDRYGREQNVTSIAILNKIPVMWRAFKWFGSHSLKIYVPDLNYEKWFIYFMVSGNLNSKGFSIVGKNVAGYFGSAYSIEHNFILLKNKTDEKSE